jgi:hypothetical protein
MHTRDPQDRYYWWLPVVGLVTSGVLLILAKVVNGTILLRGYLYCLMPFGFYCLLAIGHEIAALISRH